MDRDGNLQREPVAEAYFVTVDSVELARRRYVVGALAHGRREAASQHCPCADAREPEPRRASLATVERSCRRLSDPQKIVQVARPLCQRRRHQREAVTQLAAARWPVVSGQHGRRAIAIHPGHGGGFVAVFAGATRHRG